MKSPNRFWTLSGKCLYSIGNIVKHLRDDRDLFEGISVADNDVLIDIMHNGHRMRLRAYSLSGRVIARSFDAFPYDAALSVRYTRKSENRPRTSHHTIFMVKGDYMLTTSVKQPIQVARGVDGKSPHSLWVHSPGRDLVSMRSLYQDRGAQVHEVNILTNKTLAQYLSNLGEIPTGSPQ